MEPWNKRSRMLPRRVSTLPTAAAPPRGATAPPPALASAACGRRRALSAAPATAASLQQPTTAFSRALAASSSHQTTAAQSGRDDGGGGAAGGERAPAIRGLSPSSHPHTSTPSSTRAAAPATGSCSPRRQRSRKLQLFRGPLVKRAFDAAGRRGVGGARGGARRPARDGPRLGRLHLAAPQRRHRAAGRRRRARGGGARARPRARHGGGEPGKHRVRPGIFVKLPRRSSPTATRSPPPRPPPARDAWAMDVRTAEAAATAEEATGARPPRRMPRALCRSAVTAVRGGGCPRRRRRRGGGGGGHDDAAAGEDDAVIRPTRPPRPRPRPRPPPRLTRSNRPPSRASS